MRAQVSTARRDCGRVGIALRHRRAGCRSVSAAPCAKGSSGRQPSGRKRRRVGCQGHWWPSGRSGAVWGRSQGLPWVEGGLGGALRRQGRRSSRARLFRAYPPWAASPRSSAWRGGVLTSVKFTELCAFDSESSEKKILSSKCVFLFRSSKVTDRWLCLSPPQHGPHDCLPQRLFVRVFFDGNLCSCDITCVCGSLVGRLLVLDRYSQ
jgi:hypothetical protein